MRFDDIAEKDALCYVKGALGHMGSASLFNFSLPDPSSDPPVPEGKQHPDYRKRHLLDEVKTLSCFLTLAEIIFSMKY